MISNVSAFCCQFFEVTVTGMKFLLKHAMNEFKRIFFCVCMCALSLQNTTVQAEYFNSVVGCAVAQAAY
jgi:hypothetical protein